MVPMGETEVGGNIGPEEIEQALGRWLDFVDTQPPADHEVAEMRRRLDRGEDRQKVLRDHLDPTAAASAVRAFARGVGLTDDAYRTFLLGVTAILRENENQPPEFQRDTAAVIGLIVGLTARQLADQRASD